MAETFRQGTEFDASTDVSLRLSTLRSSEEAAVVNDAFAAARDAERKRSYEQSDQAKEFAIRRYSEVLPYYRKLATEVESEQIAA